MRLIKNGGMDCTKSGAQDFCRKSCNVCQIPRKKRSASEGKSLDDTVTITTDDCYDELVSCTALIGNGGMDCTRSGAQEFCRKSCDVCLTTRKGADKSLGLDDNVNPTSDGCYDESAACSALIGNGGMDCSKSGAQQICRKTCNTCKN